MGKLYFCCCNKAEIRNDITFRQWSMMSIILFVVLGSSWPIVYSYQVSLLSDANWQSYTGGFFARPRSFMGYPGHGTK